MNFERSIGFCGAVLVGTLGFAAVADAATFTLLGSLPGETSGSMAQGISDDGRVVVGQAYATGSAQYAFRWTSAGGMTGLGELPGGLVQSEAFAVSADGNVVVGRSVVQTTNPFYQGFRWTADTGMVGLTANAGSLTNAADISPDGSVIAGQGFQSVAGSTGTQMVRWTADDGGVQLFSTLQHGGALGMTPDGNTLVGFASGSPNGTQAAIWTSTGGFEFLGDLPGGAIQAQAEAVSADGTVVVGTGRSAAGDEAFRWTSTGGMVGLGDLAGGGFASLAYDVSADGNTVVGMATEATGNVAFIWTPGGGMQRLLDVLVAGGATGLAGWRLDSARAITPDGRFIVGLAVNPSLNQFQGFVAELTPVPLPATTWLLASAVGVLTWLRRRAHGHD